MRRSFLTVIVFSVAFLGLLPGCAISDLKNTNRRLKEANDRLVSENNRMEQELAASEKEVAEKTRLIDLLQVEKEKTPAVTLSEEPARKAKPIDDLNNFNEPGVQTTRTPQGILLRLDDRVFFPQGRATLSPKGKSILNHVARALNTRYRANLIRVEGHTDDVPVNKVRNLYPSNWELSTARACTVVRYLVEGASLNPKRIYPAGFADYKPVSSARTPQARSQNRRVEILILNEKS